MGQMFVARPWPRLPSTGVTTRRARCSPGVRSRTWTTPSEVPPPCPSPNHTHDSGPSSLRVTSTAWAHTSTRVSRFHASTSSGRPGRQASSRTPSTTRSRRSPRTWAGTSRRARESPLGTRPSSIEMDLAGPLPGPLWRGLAGRPPSRGCHRLYALAEHPLRGGSDRETALAPPRNVWSVLRAILCTLRVIRSTPRAARRTLRVARWTPRAARRTLRVARWTPRTARRTPRVARWTPRVARSTPRAARSALEAARWTPRAVWSTSRVARGTHREAGSTRRAARRPHRVALSVLGGRCRRGGTLARELTLAARKDAAACPCAPVE